MIFFHLYATYETGQIAKLRDYEKQLQQMEDGHAAEVTQHFHVDFANYLEQLYLRRESADCFALNRVLACQRRNTEDTDV